jgi:hypothetical protein
MVETPFGIDKKTWNAWSFYINIVVFILIAIFIFLLILDSYNAGKISTLATGDLVSQAWMYIARDVAFLSVALALIFFQFFKNLRIIIKRSW